MQTLRMPFALLLGGLGVAGAVASPLLAGGTRRLVDDIVVILVVATYTVVALVIERARPGNLVARTMLAGAAAWGLGEGLLAAGIGGLADRAGSAVYAVMGVLGSSTRGLGWLLLVVVVPLIFPDGRVPWRFAAPLATVCVGAFTAASLLTPEPLEDRLADVSNPIGVPDSWQLVTELVALSAVALAFLCVVVAVAGLVRRWRHGDELVRQQVLLFGLAFAPPLLVLPIVATPWARPWMFAVSCLPVPVALGVSVLQRKLYDIQLAVSRTVAYVALSLVLAGVYASVVGGIGLMLRDRGTPWLPWAAAGVVAVAFAPLRDSLQAAANRITYGRWAAPAEVLAATGRRLSDAADGTALLGSLTDELVHGLGLGYAEIRDRTGRTLARTGVEPEAPDQVDLSAYGVTVGTLSWSGRTLRPSDRDLLADLAHQMGGVVHTAGLVEQLRSTQEQLVLAREQERRRLRQDLHDGLGPSLAGLGLQVDTVQNLLAAEQPVADRLESLRSGLQKTVTEVRRIVEGLRPPAIDDLGLFGAVAELGHELAERSGLDLALDLPDARPTLPAAVEVAAYRIAQEALTNVVRHSGASSCQVVAMITRESLTVEISDDGCGSADAPPGVGMGSMRARAREIGGHVEVRALPRGTSVVLQLPLRAEAIT